MNHSYTLSNLILKTFYKKIVIDISVLRVTCGETMTQEKEVI